MKPDSACASWTSSAGNRARHEPVVGRDGEGHRDPEQRLDHDEVPDLDGVGEDQQREQRVERGARDVGAEHQPRARQPVRPDAADQEERDEREHLRAEHDSHLGRVVRQVRHEQRERDDHDAVAHRAGGLGEPEVAEVVVPQDAEALSHGPEAIPHRAPGTLTRPPMTDLPIARNTALLSAVARGELGDAAAPGGGGVDHARAGAGHRRAARPWAGDRARLRRARGAVRRAGDGPPRARAGAGGRVRDGSGRGRGRGRRVRDRESPCWCSQPSS